MLGNKVACTRMQRAGKERAHDQVYKSSAASIAQENVIEGELGDDIEEVDSGQWQLVDHHWTERVEEDLKGAKKGLAQNRVEEKGLQRCRKVGVEAINAQGFMVSQMIGLPRRQVRNRIT